MSPDRRALIGLAAAAAATPALAGLESLGAPVARTRHGPVRGYLDRGVQVFKGVRYGADTGPRRFQPPMAPAPWTEVRDATANGPASPQAGRGGEPMSEDCLFLTVWTPALRDGGKRPVMVYIHGGAYSTGSGSSKTATEIVTRIANRTAVRTAAGTAGLRLGPAARRCPPWPAPKSRPSQRGEADVRDEGYGTR